MSRLLIRNARLVNEGQEFDADVLVANGRIEKIASSIEGCNAPVAIDAQGQWLLPGMIDDQVHFRDPGAPDKGSFYSESRAAVAGGITSFMDMPNTSPATLTLEALADKKRRAALHSVANYGFHFGVSNDNLDTVAALGYTDTGDAISAGYTVCAMNRSVGQSLTERILRRILNKAADAQDAENAEPFAQAAITYLCPRF